MSTLSAHHIFRILFLIGSKLNSIGAAEISHSLNIPLTTVHRALNTLEHSKFIVHYQASKSYVLGHSSRVILNSFLRRFPLRDVAIPHMHQLVVASGDTVSLFCPVGWYLVRVASIKGTNEIIHTGPIGETCCLSDHPAGIALLAFAPPEVCEAFFEGRKKSCMDTGSFERKIEGVKTTGYIVEDSGSHRGHCAIPILDEHGCAVGVIGIEAVASHPEHPLITSPRADSYVAQLASLGERVKNGKGLYRAPFEHIDPSKIVLPSDG